MLLTHVDGRNSNNNDIGLQCQYIYLLRNKYTGRRNPTEISILVP